MQSIRSNQELNILKGIRFVSLAFILSFVFSCEKPDDSIQNPPEVIKVTVLPSDFTLYNGEAISINVNVDKSISEAKFFFDGIFIGSSISEPYQINYTPVDITPGDHKVKCIVVSGLGNEFQDSTIVKLVLRLGDKYKGGIVFSLFQDGISGLISAEQDLYINGTDGFFWSDDISIGRDVNNGVQNTKKMSENASNIEQVAYFFKNGFLFNGFNDWYIPAINELELLKENKNLIGGFTQLTGWEGLYWSSTEISMNEAEALNFNALMGNTYWKNSYLLKVRLIRKF